MAYGSLPSTTLTIPFAAGLNTKGDKRAKQPPMLDIATNVEFDDIGGLRTRYPFTAGSFTLNIYGGGTITNPRRIVEHGTELLLFTKDTLYSWNAQLSAWVSKATHLAVKIDESSCFVRTGDQYDGDRAELNGTIVYVWTEKVGSTTKGYAAAIDKTTRNVLMQPTALSGTAPARLRVTALSTKILLTFYDTPGGSEGLYGIAIDPAAPAIVAGSFLTSSQGAYYDIERIPSADQAVFAMRLNPTTSYRVGTITSALAISTATKARTCDGPIAVSCSPAGTQVQVARGNGVNIEGDLITISGLADTAHINKAIGTVTFAVTINQITAAHKTSQDSGQYRCHVFWSRNESFDSSQVYGAQTNWVDTGGSLGTQSDLVDHVGVVSRAWCHDNRVFVWLGFAAVSAAADGGSGNVQVGGALQNSYFMYRDDGMLVAKAAPGIAGGFGASTGFSPSVANTGPNQYTWCGTERRLLPVGGSVALDYSDRGPLEIVIELDSNEARRCVRLGSTLYITGGEILQYDGSGLYEVGFHLYPWYFQLNPIGSGGTMAAGTYGYKKTWRWDNSVGERERSTTATSGTAACVANDKVTVVSYDALNVTHKTTSPPAVELWRTAKNPTEDAPFYLVTKPDPGATTGDNCYLANDYTVMAVGNVTDNYPDSTATVKEANPENGGFLENVAPPAATLIAASDTRLFLAGVAGQPDRVWYSKQRNDGEVASFNEALTIQIPPAGGRITALAILQETLVVFRERAIYLLPGDGFDNAGGGSNYGPARVAASDYGAVNQESVALVPDGLLFKSGKGWCMLTRSWSVDEKVGLPISAYNSETPLAVDVMPAQHQVRVLTASRMLVWDYLVNQWGEWTISGGLDSTIWSNTHVYLASGAIKQQQSTYTGVDYGYDVESVWIKINELQGRGIVRAIEILGEARAASSMRVRLARNYESDGAGGWSYNYDKTWGVTPMVVGGPLQLKVAPTIKRPIQAIKVRLTALGPDKVSAPTTETSKLTGLSIAVAIEDGLYSGLPAAQKQ